MDLNRFQMKVSKTGELLLSCSHTTRLCMCRFDGWDKLKLGSFAFYEDYLIIYLSLPRMTSSTTERRQFLVMFLEFYFALSWHLSLILTWWNWRRMRNYWIADLISVVQNPDQASDFPTASLWQTLKNCWVDLDVKVSFQRNLSNPLQLPSCSTKGLHWLMCRFMADGTQRGLLFLIIIVQF